mmetsp:Transcript_55286/g.121144  ORF Transcript_55286/g.121144 Transcript_55286/m.121144 type:complete len:372 (+) Transcript_55286:16-1131(+)
MDDASEEWILTRDYLCNSVDIQRHGKVHRLAFGSFLCDQPNFVEVVDWSMGEDCTKVAALQHYFPPTAVRFLPTTKHVLTVGDYVRIWDVDEQCQTSLIDIKVDKSVRHRPCCPITSVDWFEDCVTEVALGDVYGSVFFCDINQAEVKEWFTLTDSGASQFPDGHQVSDVKMGHSGMAACATTDRNVFFLDCRDPNLKFRHSLEVEAGFTKIAWSPLRSELLAVACVSKMAVQLLDVRYLKQNDKDTLKPSPLLIGDSAGIECLAWNPTAPSVLIVGRSDGVVAAIDAQGPEKSSRKVVVQGDSWEPKNEMAEAVWKPNIPCTSKSRGRQPCMSLCANEYFVATCFGITGNSWGLQRTEVCLSRPETFGPR